MSPIQTASNIAQNPANPAGIAIPGLMPPRAHRTNCCQAWWTGLKTAHCPSCHATFTTISAFDKHRTGSHAYDTRTCLDPASVGLVATGRDYPCWGFPGREETDDDNEDAA